MRPSIWNGFWNFFRMFYSTGFAMASIRMTHKIPVLISLNIYEKSCKWKVCYKKRWGNLVHMDKEIN